MYNESGITVLFFARYDHAHNEKELTNMKKRRILSLSLALMLCLSSLLAVSASAANVCEDISGSSAASSSFTVKTGSRWLSKDKITITQTKGILTYYDRWDNSDESMSTYDVYTVAVQANGSSTVDYYTLKKKSLSIKLKKNTTYTVTVKPGSHAALQFKCALTGAINGWDTYPTWSVTSTKGIISCD
jgi:hypothetical protein